MKVLTIIISYNFETWINKCLSSIFESTIHSDIMVIDNASTDKSVEIIKTKYPQVMLIENKKNLGFGQANNIGLRHALINNYDYVFLLNQDAWIEKDTLKKLINSSSQNNNAGIISPVHLNGEGNELDHGFSVYSNLKSIQNLKNKKGSQSVKFINAAMWLIPTIKLRLIGGFSPIFYHYGEDIDFVNRIHKRGFDVIFEPDAIGYHDRFYRKTTYNEHLRSEKVYLLSEYANINYSFSKAFIYGILAGIKKGFKEIALLKITWQLFLNSYVIIKVRKESYEKCAFLKNTNIL